MIKHIQNVGRDGKPLAVAAFVSAFRWHALRCQYELTIKAKWTRPSKFQVHDHAAYCNGAVAAPVAIPRLEYAGE